MSTVTMYTRKEEYANNFLGFITGLEISSHLRLGDYYSNSYYFKDGSEYHIETKNGTTTTRFEGVGLAARVFRAGIWLKAHLMK